MKIIFLTLADINSIYEKSIYTDLLREFIKKGHCIKIVSPIERKHKKQTHIIQEENCEILKVKIGNYQKTNFIEKGISSLFFDAQYLRAIKSNFNSEKFDLILYSTPPITFSNSISYLKKRDNAITYLLLKDIFPQNAIDLNLFKSSSVLAKYFRKKEKDLYKVSDYIGCMSPANEKYILEKNPDLNSNKIEVNPNSIEPNYIEVTNIEKRNIRMKYNIPLDKTIFIYGGNLGIPQGVDFLIKCIDQSSNDQAFYLIVGTGTEFNKLKQYFENKKPKNAKLINFLPKEDYETLVTSSDVGLIFLDHRFTIPNFPSRLLSYMQAGMPVIAATDPNTDVGKIMKENNFGLWSVSIDPKEFHNNVDILCDEETRKIYGENARDYLTEYYTVKKSYEIIMNRLKKRNEMRK